VAWWTIMRIVIDRSSAEVEDPAWLAGVDAVVVDETAFLAATGEHPTLFATGITDLTPGPCWPTGSPTANQSGASGSAPPPWTRSAGMPGRWPPSCPPRPGCSIPSMWCGWA